MFARWTYPLTRITPTRIGRLGLERSKGCAIVFSLSNIVCSTWVSNESALLFANTMALPPCLPIYIVCSYTMIRQKPEHTGTRTNYRNEKPQLKSKLVPTGASRDLESKCWTSPLPACYQALGLSPWNVSDRAPMRYGVTEMLAHTVLRADMHRNQCQMLDCQHNNIGTMN